MGKLKGKYCVVTGGARGIGEKIVERFVLEEAAGVAILDYDFTGASKVAASLNGSTRVLAIHCDVGSADMVESSFEQIYKAFGRVDVLINNAGLTRDAMLHKMDITQWDTVLEANLKGAFLCMRQVVNEMRRQNYGKIVNISSSSAFGNVGQANYAASKAGILGLTATAAKELGRKNITVNAVLPGAIETEMLATVPEDTLSVWRSTIPLARFGQPEELAATVLFLSCDESSYVTGSSLICGGGSLISY